MSLKITKVKAVIFSLIAAVCAAAIAIGITFIVINSEDKKEPFSSFEAASAVSTAAPVEEIKADVITEQVPEAIWLAANCHKYGFIIRYPQGKENITGYIYEPWHVRYLGVETATAVYNSGLCLEEYLGITSVYS